MKLKIKGYIYRYTGLFLAHEEQCDYLESKEFWDEHKKIMGHPENDMSRRSVQGLLVGTWQCNHGFYRPFTPMRWKQPRWLWRFLAWFIILGIAIKRDIEALVNR